MEGGGIGRDWGRIGRDYSLIDGILVLRSSIISWYLQLYSILLNNAVLILLFFV